MPTRDVRNLSHNPAAIRQRMRRNRNKLSEDYEMYVEASHSYKPIEEWDYEELRKGKPRNPNGSFVGRKPAWITPLLQREIARRLKGRVLERIAEHADDAVNVLLEFIADHDVKDELRLKAATLVLEYVAGKPEHNVIVEGNMTLTSMLAGALVLDDGQSAHPIIDGSVVDEDDTGDEDDDDDK